MVATAGREAGRTAETLLDDVSSGLLSWRPCLSGGVEGPQVIIRVLSAHIAARNVAEANGLMRQLLSELLAQPGLAYLLDDDDEEVILIEEWLTPADLFEWTGGRLQKARLPAPAPSLFEDLVVTHYESLDRLPAEMELDIHERQAEPRSRKVESA
jgi:hypothetical protein